MFEVGDLIEHTHTGQQRMVVRITPAGAHGTKVSDGPVYHAALPGPLGEPLPGAHTLDIWSGSISQPSRHWLKVVG